MSSSDLDDFYSSLYGTTTEAESTSTTTTTNSPTTTTTNEQHGTKRKLDDENEVNSNNNKNNSSTTTTNSISGGGKMIPASLMRKKAAASTIAKKPTTTSTTTTAASNSAVISSKAVTYSASTISKLQESNEVKLPSYNSHITKEKPMVTMEEPKKLKYTMTAAGSSWEDPTLSEWDNNDFRLFVGDLGNDVTDDLLKQAFQKYTSFLKAKVLRDKRTLKSKGFGFVSFSDSKDYVRALREMNGKYVGNRPIKLKKSTWKNRASGVTEFGKK